MGGKALAAVFAHVFLGVPRTEAGLMWVVLILVSIITSTLLVPTFVKRVKVPDAGKADALLRRSESAVERKAQALLDKLSGSARQELEHRLAAYKQAGTEGSLALAKWSVPSTMY